MGQHYDLNMLDDYGDDGEDGDFIYDGDIMEEPYSMHHLIHDYRQEVSKYDVLNSCVVPTLRGTIQNFLLLIVFYNLLAYILVALLKYFRITEWLLSHTQSRAIGWLAINLERLVIAISGMVLLFDHFSVSGDLDRVFGTFLAVCVLGSLALVPWLAVAYNHVGLLWSAAFVMISTNEALIYVVDEPKFIKLRIVLMLIVMKSISYYYEVQNNELVMRGSSAMFRFLSIVADFGAYLLHPSTLLFGAWHPLKKPPKVKFEPTSWASWLAAILWTTAVSLLFLLVSNCFIGYYLNQMFLSWLYVWLSESTSIVIVNPVVAVVQAYFTAIEFHYSHYFICYAAQIMFVLWDFDLQITNPMAIELPRSLAEVVRAWNIPMHLWLKRYVFRKFRAQSGIGTAILATYVISSYLHGFNFQIWTVLLSLGLLSYAEFELRKRLSEIFSACLGSHACSHSRFDRGAAGVVVTCLSKHLHAGAAWFSCVNILNALFSFLGIVNLAFLGSTFDGQLDSSNMSHVFQTWKGLYFYSHGIALFMFILYKLI